MRVRQNQSVRLCASTLAKERKWGVIGDCGRKKGGVYLCYAGGVGYTTYGMIGWPRRARMFIVEKGDFSRIRTYKRLDDANFSRIHDEYIEEHLAG